MKSKKIISFLAALLLTASLPMTAFAYNIRVNKTNNLARDTERVFYVDHVSPSDIFITPDFYPKENRLALGVYSDDNAKNLGSSFEIQRFANGRWETVYSNYVDAGVWRNVSGPWQVAGYRCRVVVIPEVYTNIKVDVYISK